MRLAYPIIWCLVLLATAVPCYTEVLAVNIYRVGRVDLEDGPVCSEEASHYHQCEDLEDSAVVATSSGTSGKTPILHPSLGKRNAAGNASLPLINRLPETEEKEDFARAFSAPPNLEAALIAKARSLIPKEISRVAGAEEELVVNHVESFQHALADDALLTFFVGTANEASEMWQDGYTFQVVLRHGEYAVFQRLRKIETLTREPIKKVKDNIIRLWSPSHYEVRFAKNNIQLARTTLGPVAIEEAVTEETNWKFVIVRQKGLFVMRAANKKDVPTEGKRGLHHPSLAGYDPQTQSFRPVHTAGTFERLADGRIGLHINSGNYGLDDLKTVDRYFHNSALGAFLAAKKIKYEFDKGYVILRLEP